MKAKIIFTSLIAASILASCSAQEKELAKDEINQKISQKISEKEQAVKDYAEEKISQNVPNALSKEEAYGVQSDAQLQIMAASGICEPRFSPKAIGGIASIKCGAAVGYDFDDEFDSAVREAEILSKRKIAEAMKNQILSTSLVDEKQKKGIENVLIGDEQQRSVKMQSMKKFAEKIESNVDQVLVGVVPLAQGEYQRGGKKYAYVISGINFSTLEFFNTLGQKIESGLKERGAAAMDKFRGHERERDLPQAPSQMKSRAYYDF